MIPDGLLPLMENGREIYRLQNGLRQMYWIRVWCACRPFLEWRDDE